MSRSSDSIVRDGNSRAMGLNLHVAPSPRRNADLAPIAAQARKQIQESLGISGEFTCGVGHQPVFWHPGILAKFMATSALAAACGGGRWIHFLSDQDALDPARVDVPVRDAGGTVRRSSLRLCAVDTRLARDAVACARPPFAPRKTEGIELASPFADSALEEILSAIRSASDASTAAVQIARANEACARRWITPSQAIIPSQRLLRAGAPILERILDAPQKCAESFNRALGLDPRAARPLRVNGARSEVPVWGIRCDGRRERIDAVEARARLHAGTALLPRAFLASGLMRLACDTFFHGLGGVRYEHVGERWWTDFLGIELPPSSHATATLHPRGPDLGVAAELTTSPTISWREAWWDPIRLDARGVNETLRDATRGELLVRIARAPRKSAERRSAYKALCGHIEALRESRIDRLALLREGEAKNRIDRGQVELVRDRTWPFQMIHSDGIDALASAIEIQIKSACLSRCAMEQRSPKLD